MPMNTPGFAGCGQAQPGLVFSEFNSHQSSPTFFLKFSGEQGKLYPR